jgi:hypothetical protein
LRDVSTERPSQPDDEDFPGLDVDEELEQQWLEEWDQADRDAVDVLRGALPDSR